MKVELFNKKDKKIVVYENVKAVRFGVFKYGDYYTVLLWADHTELQLKNKEIDLCEIKE